MFNITNLKKVKNNGNLDTLIKLANFHKNSFQYKKAINVYSKIISIDGHLLPAYINLTELYNKIGEYKKTIDLCSKFETFGYKSDKIQCNLGNAFYGLKKFECAINAYDVGLVYNPKNNSIVHNKALAYMGLKKFKEACKIFEEGINSNLLQQISKIDYAFCLFELGNLDKSLYTLKQIEKLFLDKFEFNNNIGNVYSRLGKYDKAVHYLEKAKKISPKNKYVFFNIALNFFNNLLYDKAIENCEKALSIDNNFYKAYDLLGSCFQNKDMIREAALFFEKSILIKPDFFTSLFNYGNLCLNNGKVQEGLNLLKKAKELNCTYPEIDYLINTAEFNSFGVIKNNLKKFVKTFEKNLDNPQHLSSYYLPILYSDIFSNKELFDFHKKFDTSNKKVKVLKNNNNKIRIGYVSADFTGHSVGYFFEPLLQNHDLKKFDIFLYFNSNRPDEKTKKFQSYSCNWRDIFGKSDEYVYELIKNDKIDILVDLAGHTKGGRLGVFRKKPSYKQITWLGYPHTTGLKTIDYKLTDNITDPKGETEKYHSEKLYRINDCFLCYKNDFNTPISKKIPFEENNYITFGSFNNILKISEKNLFTWIDILRKVPNSMLVLKSIQYSSSEVNKNFYKMFSENGINSERVKFLPKIPSIHGHLAMYNMIDISLDTFPFNGATTTFESLYMGVPVITMTGVRHVSRVGTSILKNLNISDLITLNENDYINKAIELSKNLKALKNYRRELRDNLLNSKLCDGQKFTKKIEKAYLKIFNE